MTAVAHHVGGRIAYRDGAGAEKGCERFEWLTHAGGRTLRAVCEMDALDLIRDVSLSLDRDWRPVDGFCRVLMGGRTAASSLFLAHGEVVRFEAQIDGLGRMSQTIPAPGGLAYLGLHPVTNDGLITQLRGEDAPGVFRTFHGLTNSKSANGEIGLYAMPTHIDVAFIGYETITVAAGQFDARRFALRWAPDWPPADVWVRRHDCVFLLLRWSMIEDWFELTDFTEW
jgi:hypothetical protein